MRQILPQKVKPKHYKLEITPNFDSFRFGGNLIVDLEIIQDTSVIVCNSRDLEISSCFIKDNNGSCIGTTSIMYDTEKHTVSLHFPMELRISNTLQQLHLEFTGVHNDNMVGFYRSGYKLRGSDEQKYMLVTQFEAVDCRRCFPCWDEPALKATFSITMKVPANLTALSNMNVVEETVIDELKIVKFATTPIMSTYLVAMAVGDFEYIEQIANPSNGSPIVCRTYTLPGSTHLGHFANETAVKVLEFFSSYFNIAYPLPKLDMLAVGDFAAGAMENWGLVTYREEAILFDPANSSLLVKEDVGYTVAHELAHQWFGNLVTMKWWDELWLNEGFATFVGWLAVDKLYPDWLVFKSFVARDIAYAQSMDGQRASHAIQVEVGCAEEIDQIFDGISYSKGATVIRMLESYLGREIFAKGVSNYLLKFQYSNATTNDLWQALSEVCGQDVGKLMGNWTLKVGYPVVCIENEIYNDERELMSLELSQSRFLSSGDLKEDEDDVAWSVPIGVLTIDGITQHLLKSKNGTIEFKLSKNEYYKLNANVYGFYRVAYPSETLQKISHTVKLNLESLTVEDRIGLVSDMFALAMAGKMGTAQALETVLVFQKENSFIVLEEIANRLGAIKKVWSTNLPIIKGIDLLRIFIFEDKLEKVGFEYPEREEHSFKVLRTLVITVLSRSGHKPTIEYLNQRLQDYLKGDKRGLHPELRSAAFSLFLENSTNAKHDFDTIVDIVVYGASLDERLSALSAMGSIAIAGDMDIVKNYLNHLIFDEKTIKPQDFPTCLGSLVSANVTQVNQLVFDWYFESWPKLYKRFSGTMGLLTNTTLNSLRNLIGATYSQRIQDWINCKSDSMDEQARIERLKELQAVKRPLEQSLESVRVNTAWYERDNSSVESWFQNRKY